MRMPLVVLLHLAGPASAAHSDILDRSAESGQLMALEMCQRDEDIRIHHRAADVSCLAVLAVRHRNLKVIRAAETVRDQNLTSGRNGIESVDIRAVQMLQRVLAGTGIERVAVREERHTALLLHHVRHSPGVIRTEISEIAQLPEMHLDRHELAVHIDGSDACLPDQLLQLLRHRDVDLRAKIREIHLRLVHALPPLF